MVSFYTGSRVGEQRLREPDGRERMVAAFKLAEHRSLALFDQHDALLSTPLPFLANDLTLEVNTRLAPPGRTAGRLIFSPVRLSLTLWADDDGNLRPPADLTIIDDTALSALLARHYGDEDPTLTRAVGLRPPNDRAGDPALRTRVLKAAISARAWVLPAFIR